VARHLLPFADFFGTPGGPEATRHYLEHFRPNEFLPAEPRAMIAALAVCAETEEEADRLARSSDLLFLGIHTGREPDFLPSVETATRYPYTETERELVRKMRRRRIIGTPAQVRSRLIELAERYGVREVLINSPIHDEEARIRSYELIAGAFGLTPEDASGG